MAGDYRFRVIVPKPVEFGGVGRAVKRQEPVSGDIRPARSDLPRTSLRRREIEVRIIRMNAQRLRRAEISRMTERGQSDKLPINPAADGAPTRRGIVAGDPVFALGRQEGNV